MPPDLERVDAVAFDCDGVLVDARLSYDRTIRITVEAMVRALTDERLSLARAAPELIATVRRTGGFNSDWDSSYALTLFAYVAIKGKDRRGTPLKRMRAIAARFGSAPRRAGVKDADLFLESEFPEMSEGLKKAREFLGYPGRPNVSRLSRFFDELYFGRKLYEKSHGEPGTGPVDGNIELERTLVKVSTLVKLQSRLGRGRLAIITGRPSLGTVYSLGQEVMGYFNKEASIFIGDADVDPNMRGEYEKYRKPRPDALIRAMDKLGSRAMLYVGDSAEDMLMVKDGRAQGRLLSCLFAGVCGMAPVASDQASFFERNGADMVVKSVNEVPSRLLMASGKEATRAI
jgi:HAD superfamily phosphatase